MTTALGAGLVVALLVVAILVARLRAINVHAARAVPLPPEQAISPSSSEEAVPADGVIEGLAEPDIDFEGGELWRTLLLATPDSELSILEIGAWSGEYPAVRRRLSAAAPIARGLGQGLDKATSRAVRAAVEQGSDLYFQFEASADLLSGIRRGLLEVVPARAGMGLHSSVRSASTKRFAGTGKYVPASSGAAAAGAAGAAVPTLLPVIAVAVVTAALEYAAEAEQRKQLDEIKKIVSEVREQQIRDQISALDAAAAALDAAAALTLDGGIIPDSLGLASHGAEVNKAWHDSRRRLGEWLKGLHALPERPGPEDLSKAFPGIEDEDGAFWREIALLRVRMLLQERVTLLTAAQVATSDPSNAFPAFRQALAASAGELENAWRDLHAFVRGLTEKRVRVGRMVTGGTTNQCLKMVDRLHRLADELAHPHSGSDVPASITPWGTPAGGGEGSSARFARVAIEGVRQADGSVILLGAPTPVA